MPQATPSGTVFDGYRPGALAAVLEMYVDYYSRHWCFGQAFETKLAAERAEFLCRADPERDLFLTAWRGDRLAGTITVDVSAGGPEGAHLRWFIVADGARGNGLGTMLIGRALVHCARVGTDSVWLTTFAGLEAARRLFERHGFKLESESAADQWSGSVREQKFVRCEKGRVQG
ncbi:MAG TPA: GNAT family N-acetyltransferase [Rhizobiaceae bacterium]|nr:GNAT family N-acetyltransferase [Rhizobiaceae bacterium]